MGQRRGVGEARIHHDVLATLGPEVHQLARCGHHGEIRLQEAGAKQHDILGLHDIGLEMVLPPPVRLLVPGHQLVGHVVRRLADAGMVLALVDGAEAVTPHPISESAFDRAASRVEHLIGDRPKLRRCGVNERVEIAQRLQLGGYLLESLVPGDRPPLPGAARPNALERLLDPVRVIDHLHTRLPLGA